MGYPLSFYHPVRTGAVALRLARQALGAAAPDTALIQHIASVRERQRMCTLSAGQKEEMAARMNAVLANADLRRYVDGGNGDDLTRGVAAVGA